MTNLIAHDTITFLIKNGLKMFNNDSYFPDSKFTSSEWLKEGYCVYALNNRGENRFDLLANKGKDDSNKKISDEEYEANLNLISAAPELFNSLKTILDVYTFALLGCSINKKHEEVIKKDLLAAKAACDKALGIIKENKEVKNNFTIDDLLLKHLLRNEI